MSLIICGSVAILIQVLSVQTVNRVNENFGVAIKKLIKSHRQKYKLVNIIVCFSFTTVFEAEQIRSRMMLREAKIT